MNSGLQPLSCHTSPGITKVLVAILLLGGCATKSIDTVADHRWTELRSDNFVMMTDTSEQRGRNFLADLEEFRSYLVGKHPASIHENARPVRVVAFEDGRSFRTVIEDPHISGGFQQTFRDDYAIADLSLRLADGRLTLDSTRGSLFSPGAIVPIYVYAARQLLQHEYVEYILAASRGLRYPLWFREGYAEYLSTFRVINNRQAVIGEPPGYRLTAVQNLDWMPLDALFAARSYDTGYPVEVLYAQSWLLVHYLMSDPGRAEALQRYLTLVYDGTSEGDAFLEAFDMTQDELRSALRVYSRRDKFSVQRMDVGSQTPPRVTSRNIPEDEIKFHLGYLKLQFAGDQPSGIRLLEDALRANPGNNAARAELARLYLVEERFDAAEQLTDTGLVAGPADADLLTVQGHLFVSRALKAYHAGNPDWYDWLRKGRRNFREAVENNPRYAEAYVAFGQTFIADDVVPSSAFSALEKAAELLPSNVDILYLLGRLYMNNEDMARAEALFKEVIAWSRNPRFVARSRELLEEITGRDSQASVPEVLDPLS